MLVKVKDPGSALTHYIGMMLALFAAIPLFYRVALNADGLRLFAFSVFAAGVVLLYAASTSYHTLDISPKVNTWLRKVDHMMIFIMIAGSYTPVCLLVLGGRLGKGLLLAVWLCAIFGMISNLLWISCPKWLSSLVYILMGWLCVAALFPLLRRLSPLQFALLLSGGIIYTLGGILYALKLPIFQRLPKYFGSHEIFHCFVMAGSVCHYILMMTLA